MLKQTGIVALLLSFAWCATSFTFVPQLHSHSSINSRLQQSSTSPSEDATVQLTISSGEESDIQSIASFMVDAFWLKSPQQLIVDGGDATTVSDATRSTLLEEQVRDLTEKYGERMGKRLLQSALITAVDGDVLLGAVGIEVCLFDKSSMEVIGATKSEGMMNNAVASLGPKQRRQYKDASVIEIATELLPPEISAITCLSNLCISPNARRRGIAQLLCQKAEETASEWGFSAIYLKVEQENTAAKTLYESKMGYSEVGTLPDEMALRVDPSSGFVETTADTLILKKNL